MSTFILICENSPLISRKIYEKADAVGGTWRVGALSPKILTVLIYRDILGQHIPSAFRISFAIITFTPDLGLWFRYSWSLV